MNLKITLLTNTLCMYSIDALFICVYVLQTKLQNSLFYLKLFEFCRKIYNLAENALTLIGIAL